MDDHSSLSNSALPSCASDEQESVYLSRARVLHWIRFGLASMIFGVSAAVVGCESAPLQRYKQTIPFERFWLPLWPLNLDLRQTKAVLACGTMIMFQTLVYMIVAILPSPHSRTRLLNLIATLTSISGIIATVVGVIFAIYLPWATYPTGFTQNETINSWTCKWKSWDGSTTLAQNGQPLTPPSGFYRYCVETRAGFILLGLLIGLEALMGTAAIAGWWLEYLVTKQRKAEGIESEKF